MAAVRVLVILWASFGSLAAETQGPLQVAARTAGCPSACIRLSYAVARMARRQDVIVLLIMRRITYQIHVHMCVCVGGISHDSSFPTFLSALLLLVAAAVAFLLLAIAKLVVFFILLQLMLLSQRWCL